MNFGLLKASNNGPKSQEGLEGQVMFNSLMKLHQILCFLTAKKLRCFDSLNVVYSAETSDVFMFTRFVYRCRAKAPRTT